MKRWARESKTELAAKVRGLMESGLDSEQIAQRLGKTRRRIQQVAKLFSLQTSPDSCEILGGKVSPQET